MEGLSIIVPVHNGEKFIEKSLKQYNEKFGKIFDKFEIIVVCNACTDSTYDICKNSEKKLPVKAINMEEKGKSKAIVKGLNSAKYDYIGFIDADDPFYFKQILRIIEKLKDHEVSIATKYLRGKAKKQENQLRRVVSLAGSLFSKIVFGMNFRDTQAGAKFMRKQVWDKIDNNFISTTFDFDIEFLYKVRKNNFKVAEVYAPLNPGNGFSTLRLKYIPGMIYRLIKVRLLK